MKVEELKDKFQFGMHGCGSYKRTNHVNSLEAMRYWLGQGVKVFEVDIAQTIDELKKRGLWFACADMDGTTMYKLN